jgi:hypothetical protein
MSKVCLRSKVSQLGTNDVNRRLDVKAAALDDKLHQYRLGYRIGAMAD